MLFGVFFHSKEKDMPSKIRAMKKGCTGKPIHPSNQSKLILNFQENNLKTLKTITYFNTLIAFPSIFTMKMPLPATCTGLFATPSATSIPLAEYTFTAAPSAA